MTVVQRRYSTVMGPGNGLPEASKGCQTNSARRSFSKMRNIVVTKILRFRTAARPPLFLRASFAPARSSATIGVHCSRQPGARGCVNEKALLLWTRTSRAEAMCMKRRGEAESGRYTLAHTRWEPRVQCGFCALDAHWAAAARTILSTG